MRRLEDLRPEWQTSCAPLIQECVDGIATRVTGMLATPVEKARAEYDSEFALLVQQLVREWADRRLLPHCLRFLREGNLWPNTESSDALVCAEMTAGLQKMPGFLCKLPASEPAVPLRSWTIAAGLGALAGMIPGALLSWALTERREAGLVIGAVMGAIGLVTLVGVLAESPGVRTALTYALTVSTAGTLFGGVRAYWKQESTSGWLKGGLGLIAAWFVVFLARPRLNAPAREKVVEQLRHDVASHLRHVADLVLSWCWAHPERLPRTKTAATSTEAEALPGPVSRCLGNIYTRLMSANGEKDGLQDAVEELMQRFEDAGFEWKLVPDGTPFDEAMKRDFETFTRIEPGQPVRTRRPALRLDGRLVQKGELQRI